MRIALAGRQAALAGPLARGRRPAAHRAHTEIPYKAIAASMNGTPCVRYGGTLLLTSYMWVRPLDACAMWLSRLCKQAKRAPQAA